ncbi:MAG: hypothetical protein CVV49_02620 [Spirochaetae bacterium HGW-Spirochaetae-5]|nr:MAG: hypothetical protein CVV49_02620 [Spirochaetae bacterium HGW-Spirochaetae-5]
MLFNLFIQFNLYQNNLRLYAPSVASDISPCEKTVGEFYKKILNPPFTISSWGNVPAGGIGALY